MNDAALNISIGLGTIMIQTVAVVGSQLKLRAKSSDGGSRYEFFFQSDAGPVEEFEKKLRAALASFQATTFYRDFRYKKDIVREGALVMLKGENLVDLQKATNVSG